MSGEQKSSNYEYKRRRKYIILKEEKNEKRFQKFKGAFI